MYFHQPELTGPDGEPVEIPKALSRRLRQEILSPSRRNLSLLPGLSASLFQAIQEVAHGIARKPVEHAVVLSPEGLVLSTTVGTATNVRVPTGSLHGAHLVHNHPLELPLGTEDLEALFVTGLVSVWAVGGPWLHGACLGETDAGHSRFADLKFRSSYLSGAVFAVLSDMDRRMELKNTRSGDLEAIHQHLLLCELAAEGFIHYHRHRYAP